MPARLIFWPQLLAGAVLLAGLAGCAATPPQQAGAQAGAQQASQPDYGAALSPAQYNQLVAGNTLFRPLQTGGTTLIYVAPDQSLKLRITLPDGRVLSDSGRETVAPGKVCWQWTKAGNDCFSYFWSGRLLTFVPVNGSILPAQFLVQKGNSANL